jgi:hypothetical protein
MKNWRGMIVIALWAILFAGPIVALCLAAQAFAANSASDGDGHCEISDCKCHRAPCGQLIACPETNEVKEEKTCRKVTCEKVAIPAITLPWEQGGSPLTLFNCLRHWSHPATHQAPCTECCASCTTCCGGVACECPQRCGTARVVSVLGEEEFDVTKCETKWEVKCVAPCCCPPGECVSGD